MLVREKRGKDIKQRISSVRYSLSLTPQHHISTILLKPCFSALMPFRSPTLPPIAVTFWARVPLIHSLCWQWVKSPPLHWTSQFFVPFSQALISLCDSYVQVSGLFITMATQLLFFLASSMISSPAPPRYSPWILSSPVISLLQSCQSEYCLESLPVASLLQSCQSEYCRPSL